MVFRAAVMASLFLAPCVALGQFADNPAAKGEPPADAKVVKFEGSIDDVVIGGGGKFVLVVMRGLRQVAIYDVKAGSVVKTIELPTDEVLVAAGSDKIVMVYPDKLMVERYSLTTFAKEKKAALPVRGVIKGAVMGSASKGPLLLHAAAGSGALDRADYFFIDIASMKIIPITPASKPHRGTNFRDEVHLRAASNGTVFGLWTTSQSPQGLETFIAVDRVIRDNYEHTTVGHVIPSADGRVIYTATGGLFTPDLKSLQRGLQSKKGQEMYIPSPSSPLYFLGVEGFSGPRRVTTQRVRRVINGRVVVDSTARNATQTPALAQVYRRGKNEPVAEIDGLDEMVDDATARPGKDDLGFDKRFILLPEAGQLITVPPTNDTLVVRKVDLPTK